MRVLDVGCGAGRLSIPAARTVGPKGEVVAIDIQEAMLRKLNERIAAEGIANIRTVLGDITQIPIEGNGFDLALLVTVLGEIPDRQAALRAIFAALKPGGILCVTERIGDPHYLSSGTVLRLGESAGFCLNDRSGTWLAFTMNFRKPVKDSTMLFSPIADAGSTMISSNKA
jgi:SAM-dependent methyltransferase